jgi:hypothetical protein
VSARLDSCAGIRFGKTSRRSKQLGHRSSNWLSGDQGSLLLNCVVAVICAPCWRSTNAGMALSMHLGSLRVRCRVRYLRCHASMGQTSLTNHRRRREILMGIRAEGARPFFKPLQWNLPGGKRDLQVRSSERSIAPVLCSQLDSGHTAEE